MTAPTALISDQHEPASEGRAGLWVTDAELIRRSGVPEKIARQAIEMLDKNTASGFPKKDPLWGNRRYWPAVEMFWAKRQGIIPQTSPVVTIRERRAS